MFKWLKGKAAQAAANQCKLNIQLNTKTLISVANCADENITSSGGNTNESDIQNVINAQKSLLTDVILAHSNGLSLKTIENEIIQPIISEAVVSNGASLAIKHVLKSASEAIEKRSL